MIDCDSGDPNGRKNRNPASMGSRKNLSDERAWREFEIERWRVALRERGLQLRSMAPELQQTLFERVRPRLSWRTNITSRFPRFVGPLAIASRVLMIVALVACGYFARDFTPAAAKDIVKTAAMLSQPY